jgi:hypothetical protein
MSQEVQVKRMRQHFPDFVDNLVSGTGTAVLKVLSQCVEELSQASKPIGNTAMLSDEDGKPSEAAVPESNGEGDATEANPGVENDREV